MNTPIKPPLTSPYFSKIQAMISEIIGIDPEDITYGMEFDEVSMTPIETAEFFSRIAKDFSFRISAKDLQEYPTLGGLAEYIEDELE